MWLKDKFDRIKNSIVISNAFKKHKNAVDVQIIKGSRPVQTAIFNTEKASFVFLKEKETINKGDIIVDERNQHYQILRVNDNAKLVINVDNDELEIETIEADCIEFEDERSLFNQINKQSQSINQTINFYVEKMEQSSIGSIGLIHQNNNIELTVKESWGRLKHDLEWRFEYKEHKKYIESIDKAIETNDYTQIDQKAKEKTAKLLGAFLGEFVSMFTINLIEYLKNK